MEKTSFNFLIKFIRVLRNIIYYLYDDFMKYFIDLLEEYNQAILKVIEIPEFQEQWTRFLKGYAELLNQFLRITIKELNTDEYMNDLKEMIEKIIRNSIKVAVDSLDTVPGLGSITAGISAIDSTLKILNHTLEIIDTTTTPMFETIQNIVQTSQDTIDTITNSTKIMNELIDAAIE